METTTKVSVKDIVKGTTAKFEYASCQKIWYKIITEDKTYLFPVDLSDLDDVGTTRFESEYKAINLMRYVNKSLKSGDLVVYPTI